MKRTYLLIIMVLVCPVMSACSKRENYVSISESSPEPPPTISSSVIESSSVSASSEIPPDDYQTYYDKYIEPLKLSKVLAYSWNSLNDIFDINPQFQTVGFLVQGFLNEDDWLSLYEAHYSNDAGLLFIPQELAETTIMQHFDTSTAELRKHFHYISAEQSYLYGLPMDDGFPVDILSIEQDGDYIILHCETHVGDTISAKNDLTVFPSENGFRYVSNVIVGVSAASSNALSNHNVSGKVTVMDDERYSFESNPVAGTSEDFENIGYLVADMMDSVSYFYITSMDVSSERDLTQDEISSIITILQTSPRSIYESLGNPPVGGNYFVLVAYDASDNIYLRISFNGEWIAYRPRYNDGTFVFNGENSGLEAIREIIAYGRVAKGFR